MCTLTSLYRLALSIRDAITDYLFALRNDVIVVGSSEDQNKMFMLVRSLPLHANNAVRATR